MVDNSSRRGKPYDPLNFGWFQMGAKMSSRCGSSSSSNWKLLPLSPLMTLFRRPPTRAALSSVPPANPRPARGTSPAEPVSYFTSALVQHGGLQCDWEQKQTGKIHKAKRRWGGPQQLIAPPHFQIGAYLYPPSLGLAKEELLDRNSPTPTFQLLFKPD